MAMSSDSRIKIVDATESAEHEKYLYRCLTGPFRRYRKRIEYLERAIPKGFRKKLLLLDGNVVGQIEYARSEASYYPITGENTVVMNCIWVLRKAKGHNLGAQLLENMVRSGDEAEGFATIALENHWSPWFQKPHMEKLGFKPIDSISVTHKTKRKGQVFTIYLMWIPNKKWANPPKWNTLRLLEGLTSCTAHPLYHPQTFIEKHLLNEHKTRNNSKPAHHFIEKHASSGT